MKPINELITELKQGGFDESILDICSDSFRVDHERERYIKALETYRETFPGDEVSIFSAPGRTEVCGNHTDHQHGQVLAASINRDAIAVASPRSDGRISLLSDGRPLFEADISDLEMDPADAGTTRALIRGVLRGLRDMGHEIGGFNAYVTSDVLTGAGLSSSAAFETVLGTIINGLYNHMLISPVDIAKAGQFAENTFFGKPCGLMDQMACSVGDLIHIDFADPREPAIDTLSLDLNKFGMSLIITDTKGSHADLTSDYAAVPKEMKSVANLFGKSFLRDIDEEDILNNISFVRRECGDRAVMRALHFFEENRRVARAADAIRNNDISSFLECIRQSGDSSFRYLQNVYTNSDICHQNVSVALMLSDRLLEGGKGVSRVHGGGFAGTIQAYVRNEAADEYRKEMDKVFGNGSSSILKIRKYGGIKIT